MKKIMIAALSVLALSCVRREELEGPGQQDGQYRGRMVCVQLIAEDENIISNTPGTRAVTEDDCVGEGSSNAYIKDIILLEYDQQGHRIGKVKYFDMADMEAAAALGGTSATLPILFPENASDTYTVVVLGNTHSASLAASLNADAASGTLERLKCHVRKIGDLRAMYNVSSETCPEHSYKKDLSLCGSTSITSATDNLSCILYRTAAKIELNLKVKKSTDITLTEMHLCHVPKAVSYADCLWGVGVADELSGVVSYADIADYGIDKEYFDTPLDKFEDYGGRVSGTGEDADYWMYPTMVYYVPRNISGTTGNTAQKSKNTDAPDYALNVKIVGLTSNNLPIGYTIYPGLNNYNDFNIVPNTHYQLNLRIDSIEAGNVDSRVDNMGMVTLATGSNSFIINPFDSETQKVYKLPVNQMYRYWCPRSDRLYSANSQRYLVDNENWYAEVLWQDRPNESNTLSGGWQIEFVDPTTVGDDAADADILDEGLFFRGSGDDYIYFRPIRGAKGNVVIGVKQNKDDSEYLWSWHLWITDYNPDIPVTPVAGTYVYSRSAMNGEVHRYAYAGLWGEGKPYANSFIMDRNVGMDRGVFHSGYDGYKGMLYYQFGRKDPMPHSAQALYAPVVEEGVRKTKQVYFCAEGRTDQANQDKSYSSGAKTDCMNIDYGQKSMDEAVKAPSTFIAYGGNWNMSDDAQTYDKTGIVWNDPQTEGNMYGGKSLFDPCPAGWKMPLIGTWDIGFSVGARTDHFSGQYFNQDSGEGIYYPNAGNRSNGSGAMSGFDLTYWYHWSASPYSSSAGYAVLLRISQGWGPQFYTSQAPSRALGSPVRCVQDK